MIPPAHHLRRRRLVGLVLALALWGGTAFAQTVTVAPELLQRIPTAQVGNGRYWQQLKVVLGHDDAASAETVAIDLPEGVALRDGDGDGALFDEVRVVYRAVAGELPRFKAATVTTATRIVVSSQERAGAGGELYVQFPIVVTAPSPASATVYRAVQFADPREQDLDVSVTPLLTFVGADEIASAGSMGLVDLAAPVAPGADTATTAKGTEYPSQSQVLVLSLPDLVFDSGLADPNRGAGQGDGDEANDTVYRFFFANRSDLLTVDATVAAPAVRAETGVAYVETEGVGEGVRLLTRDLPAGTYWLYATADVTGSVPLARSRALQVRHEPIIEQLGPAGTEPITFDSGGLLDATGAATGNGQRRLVLELSVVDHDDSAIVHLFYSGNPNLGPQDVRIEGETAFLDGAAAITIRAGLPEETTRFAWDTVEPTVVPEGDDYIYAVAVGGTQVTVARAPGPIQVRHAPFLRLDPLNDDGATERIVTGGTQPQRHVTITWSRSGVGGDFDADDDAAIDLYYSDRFDLAIPGDADALVAAAADPAAGTHVIATGLREDPDGRGDNQFVWDLWALEGSQAVPVAGRDYALYAVIADGRHRRLVQMNGGRTGDGGSRLRFAHPPTLRPVQPAADASVEAGHSARVSWEDLDLDDDARIRVVLSAEDHGAVTDYNTVTSGLAFVVNSADGGALPDVDPVFDLSEDSPVDYLDVGTSHLTRSANAAGPPQPGTYHLYLAISDSGRFDGETRVWQAPGRLVIADPTAVPVTGPFRLLPESFAIANGGGTQTVDVIVDAGGDTVDLALLTLRVDGDRFATVDQDTAAPGDQPFRVAAGYSPSKLVTNSATTAGDGALILALEYFDPGPSGIPGLALGRTLVHLELVAKTGLGRAPIQMLADSASGQLSQLELDGRIVAAPAAAELAQALLVAGRAAVGGRVHLEGRTTRSGAIDVALRQRGAYADLDDEGFAAANDTDADRPGVQVPLDDAGDFALVDVPTGRLDLIVRHDGHLEGRAGGLDLFPGALVSGLQPSTSGAEGDSLLLGGDVAGYVDATGQSLPDNEVTLADWDYVASLFDRQLGATDDSVRADITGDGRVNIRDLSLVGANYLRRGLRPVYRATGAAPAAPVGLALIVPDRIAAGDTVTVALRADGDQAARVHALQVDLRVDGRLWHLLSAAGPAGAFAVQRERDWGRRLAVAAVGPADLAWAGQVLAQWRLVARVDDPAPPRLGDLLLLDGGHADLAVALAGTPTGLPATAALPRALALRPNYPNPFNPATTIAFDVPAGGPVRLEVFDALGQRVAVLADEALPPGTHRVTWDGRDGAGRAVASGVYFARLSAGDLHRTGAMVLVR